MKSKNPDVAIVRRLGRRKSRVKIGLRAFAFFIALALVLGAVVISLNIRYEDRMRQEMTRRPG